MEHFSDTILQSQQGNRSPAFRNELPKQDPIPPKPAADQPVFGVRVPNYNTQRPRVQNKKTWWRWDFV
jgi:hypothetical protein